MAEELTDERLRELYARATAARRSADRAACPSPEALLALVRREGAEQGRLETLDHAMSCADCRGDLELLRAIESGRRRDAGDAVRSIRWRRPLGIGLAGLAAASIAMFALVARRGSEGDVTRDVREDAIRVVVPADDEFTSHPTFLWHSVPGARGYTLEVLTPDGTVRASRQTSDTTAALSLATGEYRWWVRAEVAGGERRSTMRRLRVSRPVR